MPTGSFADLMQRHLAQDPAFAEALLRDGIEAMLGGDVETGKTILREYIKATVGFEKLGHITALPPMSLIRMFGPRGNPQAKHLFNVIGHLQERAGLHLVVTLAARPTNTREAGMPPTKRATGIRKSKPGLAPHKAA